VSHKALLISYEVESTIIIVPSHGQSQPLQFPPCDFSILRESCAYCQQSHGQISQRHEVSHKALLSVGSHISLMFPPHKFFFRTHIYRHGLVVKTVILQANLHCTRAKARTYYRYIGIFLVHESSQHHWFPEVGRPWHHWQTSVNAGSNNQSAMKNAITIILLSHR
jgi:hypothetical protein